MENSFAALIENSKQAVKYWWLLLLTGIALLVIGIVVFAFPAQSYIGMSLMFGWLILLSGIFQVILSTANKHYITGRGWMLAGGIIEIVLGAILVWNVALSAATLPIFLGFWLMFRGFSAIGLGGERSRIGMDHHQRHPAIALFAVGFNPTAGIRHYDGRCVGWYLPALRRHCRHFVGHAVEICTQTSAKTSIIR